MAGTAAQPGHVLGLLDDRATGRIRPNLFTTHACAHRQSGYHGEKWFTSAGRVADNTLCDALHERQVRRAPPKPGREIQPGPATHKPSSTASAGSAHHLLGPEDGAKALASDAGGGRIQHAMRTLAQCKLAFDMMCERALSRESHGRRSPEPKTQMVQEKVSPTLRRHRMLRLLYSRTPEDRQHKHQGKHAPDMPPSNPDGQGTARGVFQSPEILGSLGTTAPHPVQASMRPQQRWASSTRRTRSQIHRRPPRAQGLPAPRGHP